MDFRTTQPNTTLPTTRSVVLAQHAMLLVGMLMLIWSCVFAPRLLAAPADKPAAMAEKTLPKAEKPQTNLVNINSADAAALAAGLTGIGLKKAEAIVAYRQEKGKFTAIEQLLDVKGIGQATLDKNRDKITL